MEEDSRSPGLQQDLSFLVLSTNEQQGVWRTDFVRMRMWSSSCSEVDVKILLVLGGVGGVVTRPAGAQKRT